MSTALSAMTIGWEDVQLNLRQIVGYRPNYLEGKGRKWEKYHKLAQFFRTEHGVRTTIIPVVVGAFGSIPVKLPVYLNELGIPDVVGGLQKTALLGTQRILKNVLSL